MAEGASAVDMVADSVAIDQEARSNAGFFFHTKLPHQVSHSVASNALLRRVVARGDI